MNILIFNSQALGDQLLGTHMARLIKKDHPDSYIVFAIQRNAMLTMSTNDPDKGLEEIIEILKIQFGIDGFALLDQQTGQLTFISGQPISKFDKIYHQPEWWSDLGMAASMQVPYYVDKGIEIKRENIDTETQFTVGTPKELPNHLRVCTAGPLDWNNKVKRDETRLEILESLVKYEVEVIQLGADVGDRTYLQALQILNNSHLYLGPEGSMAHVAAGLGVDTLLIGPPYPAQYLLPEFYHSGDHSHVMTRPEGHCGDYHCVTPKPYTPVVSWGNPPLAYSSWPAKCPYTLNGRSCVWNVSAEDIMTAFSDWYMKNVR